MARLNKAQAVFISILFAAGYPLEQQKMAEILECDLETLKRVEASVNEFLQESLLPLMVMPLEDSYQLVLKAEYAPYAKAALNLKRNTPLSQAAMEVLAIIGYNQPVTKSFVEQIRGVDSSSTISMLVEKELIEEAGRLDLPGKPIAYVTTKNFLRTFSLKSLEELPKVLAEENNPVDDDNLEGQVTFGD